MPTGGSGGATLNRGAGCDGSGGTYEIKIPRSMRKTLERIATNPSRGVAAPSRGPTRLTRIKTREACEAKGYVWMRPAGESVSICNPPGLDSVSIKVTLPRGANCKGRTSTKVILAKNLPASVQKALLAAAIRARKARLKGK